MDRQDEHWEEGLVASIRSEAESVKQCFTSIAFQTLTVGAMIAGAILASAWTYPLAALVAVPLAFLVTSVCRVGLHKYATANRNAGYQLHLERTVHIPDEPDAKSVGGWQRAMRRIGWEEALRACPLCQRG